MAIELEPNLADGYSTLGMIRTLRGEYIEAELAYRRAMELTTSTEITMQYGLEAHYQSVGNLQRAYEICEETLKNDPLYGWWRGYYILILGALGDMQKAEEEYDHGRALLGDKWFWGDFYIWPIRLGKSNILSPSDILYGELINDTAKDYLDSPEQGLAELRRLYADEDNLTGGQLSDLSLWAAYFGDPDFAMDLMEKAVSIRGDRLANLWLPVMHQVRQMPRFKEFIREIGLVDYWNKFGWPDICHPRDDGDFECN
jgi:tetratricopeptide (TPR) repeat protein